MRSFLLRRDEDELNGEDIDKRILDARSQNSKACQHSVQLTGQYVPRFLASIVALSSFRFDGESAIPPTAGNADCWRRIISKWNKA